MNMAGNDVKKWLPVAVLCIGTFFSDGCINTLPADIEVDPVSLDFEDTFTEKNLSIVNLGHETLDWTVALNDSSVTWCSFSPASGSNDGTVTVTVNRSKLLTVNNETALVVFSNGGRKIIPVYAAVLNPGGITIHEPLTE